MNTKDGLTTRTVDELDPDNWLRIPDFGVNPQDVDFKGFALPIITQSDLGYGLQRIVREHVRTARFLIRAQKSSLSEIQADFVQVQDMIEATGKSEKLNPSYRQVMAALYMQILQSAEIAVKLANAKSPIKLAVCYGEIAKCAEGIRNLSLLSLNGKDESLNFVVTRVARHFKAQKQARSDAGKHGAGSKHAPATALKKWALKTAARMRGAGMNLPNPDMARKLSNNLPAELVDAVKDPGRLILKALRAPQSLD
jgi:hypothetical protein